MFSSQFLVENHFTDREIKPASPSSETLEENIRNAVSRSTRFSSKFMNYCEFSGEYFPEESRKSL